MADKKRCYQIKFRFLFIIEVLFLFSTGFREARKCAISFVFNNAAAMFSIFLFAAFMTRDLVKQQTTLEKPLQAQFKSNRRKASTLQ